MERGLSAAAAFSNALRHMSGSASDANLRQAAWVARCVGRGEGAPLRPADVVAIADVLETRVVDRDTVIFRDGQRNAGVWIIREGRVELAVGSGRGRAVVQVLRPGDVDGDIQLLLDMRLPYTARALTSVTTLYLSASAFEALLVKNPTIARRWLSSIALRLATSQARILGLLGQSLIAQVSRLLLDEADGGTVALTQQTIAAMLGVRRPSLNKILKELERDGLIAISYGTIAITDERRLARRR